LFSKESKRVQINVANTFYVDIKFEINPIFAQRFNIKINKTTKIK